MSSVHSSIVTFHEHIYHRQIFFGGHGLDVELGGRYSLPRAAWKVFLRLAAGFVRVGLKDDGVGALAVLNIVLLQSSVGC